MKNKTWDNKFGTLEDNASQRMKEIEGLKYDNDKNRMGLVLQGFSNALWKVGEVGTFGAGKYGDENWMYLENGIARYKDALFRHLFQYLQGEWIDAESGKPHLAHACWNCLALLEYCLKLQLTERE